MYPAPMHVPRISISLAPPEEPLIEPYSPFSSSSLNSSPLVDDDFRPVHLTPPPTLTRFGERLSPLRPSDDAISPKGVERGRFEAMLQASRDRNPTASAKRALDLRKEIALKAHNKQIERRSRFLSKVFAPPSPTATLTPVTPPESPAIFHYSLPSPGLVSPLSLFDDPKCDPMSYSREPWIEQVDFRALDCMGKQPASPIPARHFERPLPSLDQISARLSSQRQVRKQVNDDTTESSVDFPTSPTSHQATAPERPRLSIGIGRLQMPLRISKPVLEPLFVDSPISLPQLPDSSLPASCSRERRAHDMLSTLRRRTLQSETPTDGADDRKTKWKRHSAPADLMPLRQRVGFEHPVLALPGGF